MMILGISEKAALTPAGGKDGRLVTAAWYFDGLDDTTEKRVAETVRSAIA
ncbi:hypothetical protein OH146_11885 [Salinibacterium sp. SYSU T00001]|nr:hypothetical protein [Salinibacterium sedimenticola]MCW4386473.1 hypothetical protein [Salinibacterium sedimenticola]